MLFGAGLTARLSRPRCILQTKAADVAAQQVVHVINTIDESCFTSTILRSAVYQPKVKVHTSLEIQVLCGQPVHELSHYALLSG